MAHFAQLDENNVVLQVMVIANEDTMDDDGQEDEATGVAFCQSLLGAETRWAKTSYNDNSRLRYAAIGGTYDPERDAFIDPQPYPSWTLDNETLEWVPPIPMQPGQTYWDEELQQWI